MNKETIGDNLEYIVTNINNIADGLEDARKIVEPENLEAFYMHMAYNLRRQTAYIDMIIKETRNQKDKDE